MTKTGRNRLMSLAILLLFCLSFLFPQRPSVHDEQMAFFEASGAVVRSPSWPDNRRTGPDVDFPGLLRAQTAAVGAAEAASSNLASESPYPDDAAASVAAPTPQRVDGQTAIGNLILRSGPDLSYETTAILPTVTAVQVVGRSNDGRWLEVEIAEGKVGWLVAENLNLERAFDLTSVPVQRTVLPSTSALLNDFDAVTRYQAQVRVEPGLDASISSRNIPVNTPVNTVGRDEVGLWVAIADMQGFAGWILASSLRFTPGFEIMALPVTEFVSPAAEPFRVDRFEWGAQTHNIRANGDLAAGMGMGWIKVQYKFHVNSRPGDVVDLIEQAHQRGLKILLAIPGQIYPTHIDYVAYVEFLRGVAALDTPPDAIEVWNEMNIDFEWPAGQIDPAVYVTFMLAPAYRAIKAENPNIMVISGAPAPTGFHNGINAWADDRYIIGMAQAGAANYFDCLGVHYNAGATHPTATSGHPAGDFYGWYYLPSLKVYYETFGREKPLCITELGYLTGDGLGKRMPDRFWWANQTTLNQQADWLATAIRLAQESGFVQMAIIFSLDIHHFDDFDPQAGYAIIRPDQSCPTCLRLDFGQ